MLDIMITCKKAETENQLKYNGRKHVHCKLGYLSFGKDG